MCSALPTFFSGQVLMFFLSGFVFSFLCVFRSRSLQKRSGMCLNASGGSFCIEFCIWKCKNIWKSMRSEHFGILQFGEFLCQPFGKNTFSKNWPKMSIGNLQTTLKFLSNQITARNGKYTIENQIINTHTWSRPLFGIIGKVVLIRY